MSASCDGYEKDFSLTHVFWIVARVVWSITQCHNEVRDALGDLVTLGCREVVREPVVCNENDVSPGLVAVLGVRVVWIPQGEALV